MSDANYRIIHTLFIAVNTSWSEESAPAQEFALGSNVPADFFEFLSTDCVACLKPTSQDDYRKASYPRTQQRDQGAGLNPEHAIRVVAKKTPYPFGHAANFSTSFVSYGCPSYFYQMVALATRQQRDSFWVTRQLLLVYNSSWFSRLSFWCLTSSGKVNIEFTSDYFTILGLWIFHWSPWIDLNIEPQSIDSYTDCRHYIHYTGWKLKIDLNYKTILKISYYFKVCVPNK